MKKSVALLLVVENDKNNKGDTLGKYGKKVEIPYEREAIACVEHWRKNGGKYKNCNIYAINVNGNPPNISTIKILEELKVNYIETYLSLSKDFPCGYWMTPFSLMYLEAIFVREEILIHIDLDMILMREPTKELFTVSKNKIAKLAINKYRPTDSLSYKISPIYPFEIATNFIISKRKNQFYKQWWIKLFNTRKTRNFDNQTLCIFEERILDEMYNEGGYLFDFFDMDYQLEDDSNTLPFFIHAHLDNTERFQKLIGRWISLK